MFRSKILNKGTNMLPAKTELGSSSEGETYFITKDTFPAEMIDMIETKMIELTGKQGEFKAATNWRLGKESRKDIKGLYIPRSKRILVYGFLLTNSKHISFYNQLFYNNQSATLNDFFALSAIKEE